ncbi:hypothetical protein Tco_1056740 [Tanacetum coccineum]|uniref:Uncharacterized protein n=1 Tax=Tanacetum coccineum TaxID=301880 RepID=A0ABQ5H3C8_9ASTR
MTLPAPYQANSKSSPQRSLHYLEKFKSRRDMFREWKLSYLVAELKTLKWELLAEFLALPSQILSVQAKLQTLDTLPSLLNKVADTLTRFPNIMKNVSYTAKSKGVPSVGPATDSPAEVGKNTNPAIMDA